MDQYCDVTQNDCNVKDLDKSTMAFISLTNQKSVDVSTLSLNLSLCITIFLLHFFFFNQQIYNSLQNVDNIKIKTDKLRPADDEYLIYNSMIMNQLRLINNIIHV